MNCDKCLLQCKAACCGVVPFDKKFVEKNKPSRKVKSTQEFGDKVILETEDLTCPYLSKDYKCTIYDDRPEVCRLFGNETHKYLTCPYQTKDGKIRDRADRRRIEKLCTLHVDL